MVRLRHHIFSIHVTSYKRAARWSGGEEEVKGAAAPGGTHQEASKQLFFFKKQRCHLRCSMMLWRLHWYSATDASGKLIGPRLTLRRLMSYIYIYIYIYMEHPFLMFLDHTQRRSTVGRTPLDE